eukprot:scaffold25570_cov43-Attheya_sp.AAC.3
MTHVGWCGKIPGNGRYKADNYSARRDWPVVKRSDDLAGTSFGRKVDSGPSSCKTRVVKTSVTVSFVVHVDRYVASSSPCFAVL